jgi:hypothetical protein
MSDDQYSKPLEKWMAVDFDGTLATDWEDRKSLPDAFYILGKPIQPMVKRVKLWLKLGIVVKIFTSRVAPDGVRDVEKIRQLIEIWCEEHIGTKLEVTCIKDHGIIHIWDDKACTIVYNTGLPVWEIDPIPVNQYSAADDIPGGMGKSNCNYDENYWKRNKPRRLDSGA